MTVQWENKKVSASLNGYVNSINNYIYLTPTNNTIGPMRVFNWVQHDAKISGLELNLKIHPANSVFEGYINGGVIRGKLTDGQGDLPYIPANKLITGLTWKNNDAKKWMNPYVTFQVGCYGSQDNVARYEETTAGYVLTDIYFGVKPPFGKKQRWSAVLFCNNIFNIGYFNHLSLIKSINVREPGRNFGIQMKYDF